METEPAAYPATSLAIRRRGMGYQPISMRRVSNVDRPVSNFRKITIVLQLQASSLHSGLGEFCLTLKQRMHDFNLIFMERSDIKDDSTTVSQFCVLV